MATRVIRRNITDQLLQALTDTPVVLINGARQTEKSTLVQSREVADEHSRQYLTFDDPGVLAAARRDPNGFLAGLTTVSGTSCSMAIAASRSAVPMASHTRLEAIKPWRFSTSRFPL